MPELSVVIPTMNEKGSIKTCLEKVNKIFTKHNIDGEIILADNSTDETPEIAKSLGAKIVTPDKLGYSYAVMYGIDHSVGNYIFMADADGTYDVSELPKFVEPLKTGEADVVIGSRFKGEIKKGAMPWLHQYIGNPLLTWSLNRLLGTKLSDAHCGMRAFTRNVWQKTKSSLITEDFCSEMLRNISKNDLTIKEIPVVYYLRNEKPKAGTFLHGWRCFSFLIWHILLRR